MKILMTGMASAHCSTKGNYSFFSGLYKVFSEFADVTISEPKLSWTRSYLQEFDAVIVGITPPTSIAANKIYGAIHVLDLMYESNKLRIVVDSPQVWQFKNSINSFTRNPLQVFGSMYRLRKDYEEASTKHVSTIKSLADKMSSIQWPKTYVPLLPWSTVESVAASTGFLPVSSTIGLQIDSIFLDRKAGSDMVKAQRWAVDNVKSSWWISLAKTLRYPGIALSSSKKLKDSEAEQTIAKSIGLIIPPQDRKVGTWWSYRYIQALNLNSPIVTYWQDAHGFSESWSKLAYQVEDMDAFDRQNLAEMQFKDYVDSVPNLHDVINTIKIDLIESSKERI